MDIFHIFQLVGGVGLFLYGMKYLGSALENLAGANLEKTLEKLTGNKLKGLLLGIFVTAVIQSSSATTIMLVGFVNAGIMKLAQAVPVLLGANIGTTITGQILRLGDIGGGGSMILTLLKPSSFAPLAIGIAAFIMLLSKKKKALDIAAILMGFGILFFGMTTMETALDPLKASASFQETFVKFTNPFAGFLLGILLALILQSASASVGVVQAVAAASGSVTFAVIAPIIMGISWGKLLPMILASFGTKKEAQQVTISQVFVNGFGAVMGMIILYLVLSPLGFVKWDAIMTRGTIADFNTGYNLLVGLAFIPFTSKVAKLARKLRGDAKPSKIDQELALLDTMLLNTPAVALEQCRKVINGMGVTAIENYGLALDLRKEYTAQTEAQMTENEQFLDKSETLLNDYLVKVNARPLRTEDQRLATEIMHSVMDFERIGDHCIKLAKVSDFNIREKITFSTPCEHEIDVISDAVDEILKTTVAAFTTDDLNLAVKVEPLREVITAISELLRKHHIDRLRAQDCSVQAGISLVEYLTSYERISAYCSNIALHVIEKCSNDDSFDMHTYTKEVRTNDAKYKELYEEFSAKYLRGIKEQAM